MGRGERKRAKMEWSDGEMESGVRKTGRPWDGW